MNGVAYSSIPTFFCNVKAADTNVEKATLLAQVYAKTISNIKYNNKFLDCKIVKEPKSY